MREDQAETAVRCRGRRECEVIRTALLFEGEVTGVVDVDLGIRQVALVCIGAGDKEYLARCYTVAVGTTKRLVATAMQ